LAARLQALQAYDDELRVAYRKTAALTVAQAMGGELSRFYRDAAQLFLADADLAFERGDRATGVGLLKKSFCCACDCLDAIPNEPHRGADKLPTTPEAAALQRDIGLRMLDDAPDTVAEILAEWKGKPTKGNGDISGTLSSVNDPNFDGSASGTSAGP
jgi:hypothetical protein